MNWFRRKKKKLSVPENKPIVSYEPEWVELKKEKPPHEVVLAACDTSDCSWVIDSAWWNDNKKCWMTTGTVEDEPSYLNYTHWRPMVNPPNNKRKEIIKSILEE